MTFRSQGLRARRALCSLAVSGPGPSLWSELGNTCICDVCTPSWASLHLHMLKTVNSQRFFHSHSQSQGLFRFSLCVPPFPDGETPGPPFSTVFTYWIGPPVRNNLLSLLPPPCQVLTLCLGLPPHCHPELPRTSHKTPSFEMMVYIFLKL